MSLAINNNVSSLQGQHNLNRTSNMLSKSLERLSSGLKINRGADGPAALVISEQQRAQIAGLNTALDNTAKAVSMVQTTEGALNEINSLLVKVRGLALDSANSGVQDANTFAANQAEVANALATIDRIANNTQFGTKKVLDGSAGTVGTTGGAGVTVLKTTADTAAGSYAYSSVTAATRGHLDAANGAGTTLDSDTNLAANETLTINGVQVQLTAGMTVAQARDTINTYSSQTGVFADANGTGGALRLIANQFGSNTAVNVSTSATTNVGQSGFSAPSAYVAGTNIIATIAGATGTVASGNVITVTGGASKGLSISFAESAAGALTTVATASSVTVTDQSLVFQIGANANQTAKLAVDKVTTSGLGLGVSGNQFTNLGGINVQSASAAQDALKIIDQAVNDLSTLRGRLGAFQSQTLESTANSLRSTLENTVNAESVIRDTDFAKETANFTKYQVMVQAGTTVLSNANQTSQLVLGLLRG